MDITGKIVLTTYAVIAGIFLVLLVFLIIKRIRNKKTETFEQRDN